MEHIRSFFRNSSLILGDPERRYGGTVCRLDFEPALSALVENDKMSEIYTVTVSACNQESSRKWPLWLLLGLRKQDMRFLPIHIEVSIGFRLVRPRITISNVDPVS